MQTRDLLLIAGLAAVGYGAYKMFSTPTPPANVPPGSTYMPPGSSFNGYLNNTGQPVWLTATGLAVNLAGQILQTLNTAGVFDTGGNNNNADSGGGY